VHPSVSSESSLVTLGLTVPDRFEMKRRKVSEDEYASKSILGRSKSSDISSKADQVIDFKVFISDVIQAVVSTRGASNEDFVVFAAPSKGLPSSILAVKPFFERFFDWPAGILDSCVLTELSRSHELNRCSHLAGQYFASYHQNGSSSSSTFRDIGYVNIKPASKKKDEICSAYHCILPAKPSSAKSALEVYLSNAAVLRTFQIHCKQKYVGDAGQALFVRDVEEAMKIINYKCLSKVQFTELSSATKTGGGSGSNRSSKNSKPGPVTRVVTPPPPSNPSFKSVALRSAANALMESPETSECIAGVGNFIAREHPELLAPNQMDLSPLSKAARTAAIAAGFFETAIVSSEAIRAAASRANQSATTGAMAAAAIAAEPVINASDGSGQLESD